MRCRPRRWCRLKSARDPARAAAARPVAEHNVGCPVDSAETRCWPRRWRCRSFHRFGQVEHFGGGRGGGLRCHWFCCRCRRRFGRRIEFRQHGVNLVLAIGHRCWRWHGRFWRSWRRRCRFRWRRRRNRTGWSSCCRRLLRWRGGFGRLGRLGCIVVGNDTPDGGKDFLHRRLLRLRRLRHSLKIPTHSLRSTPR